MHSLKQLKSNAPAIIKNTSKLIRESILNEAIADEATAAEEVIAVLIRNQNMNGFQVEKEIKNPTTDDFKFLVEYFTEISKSPIKDQAELVKTVQRAIVKVKSFGLPFDASQYGTTKESPTETWSQVYGGESAPIMPKTDVINAEKHHSVKMRGPVHILDGTQKQVGALCLYSLDQTKEKYSKKILNSVDSQLREMQQISAKLSRIPDEEKYKKFADEYKKQNPKAKAKEIRDAAKKANLIVGGGDIRSGDVTLSVNTSKMLDSFQNTIKVLNTKIENVFSSINADDDFKRVFLRESMSGEFMFDRRPASANSIIVWEKNFRDVELISIDYAVEEVLPKFKVPKFDTKSSGNWMTIVGKLQTDLSKFEKESNLRAQVQTRTFTKESNTHKTNVKKSKVEEMMIFMEYSKKLMNTHMSKLKESTQSLKEGILTEESFFEKIKIIFNRMIEGIKVIARRVSNFFAEVTDALSSSPSNIFEFFDLKIEVDPDYKVKIRF